MPDSEKSRTLPLPPRQNNPEDGIRRIGVEIEMSGPDVAEAARIVARQIGGEVQSLSDYEFAILGDEPGEWRVEVDQQWLKKMGRERAESDGEPPLLERWTEDLLRLGSEWLVPVEVVSPPLPLDRLDEVGELTQRLRKAGAVGTEASPAYAFGLQLNPEMPALDAATIVAYLKAFLCLFEWLKSRSDVDVTRKLTGFANPFPVAYVRRVVDPEYAPDLDSLIDDYLEHNPTRNRALDMLPLFAHLDEERVRAAVDDPRIKSRPTLHYRLPNSELGRKSWGIHEAWRDWLQVEHLAADEDRLKAMCQAYCEHLDTPLGSLTGDWSSDSERWLSDIDNP